MPWLRQQLSRLVTETIGKLPEVLDQVTGQAREISFDARIPALVARETRRQADRWMTEELGLPVRTHFRDVYEFVDEFLVEFYPIQQENGRRWCSHWWEHPAAVRRLTLMWASWEHHRADAPATGEEVWARVVGDYHFRWLTGPYGPFIRCTGDKHSVLDPLKSDPIPVTFAEDDEDPEDFGDAPSDGPGPRVSRPAEVAEDDPVAAAAPAVPAGGGGYLGRMSWAMDDHDQRVTRNGEGGK
jgi:hypothetical protein